MSCGLLERESCDLRATAAEVAGPDAVACPFADMRTDGSVGWACAVDAFDRAAAFFLLYDAGGIGDSVVIDAIVSDGAQVWLLRQDQYGGEPYLVDGWDCVAPVVDAWSGAQYIEGEVSGYAVIECSSLEPENTHYQVCGEICGSDECSPQPLPFER